MPLSNAEIKEAMLSRDFSSLANNESVEDAYSPFDALAGGASGVVGGGRFLANAVADPLIHTLSQYLAENNMGGMAAILGKKPGGALIKDYLRDTASKPAKWYNASDRPFFNFDKDYLGKQSGAVKDSKEAFFASASPDASATYIPKFNDMEKDFTWAGADKATQYNWLQRHGKNTKHREMLRKDLDNPNSFDAQDFERLNYKDWQIKNRGSWETTEVASQYEGPNMREMHLDAQNPYIKDMEDVHYDEDLWYNTIRTAKDAGHDMAILKNVRDGGGIKTDVAAFWDPNKQVVSPYEHLSGNTPEPSLVEKLWGKDAVKKAMSEPIL